MARHIGRNAWISFGGTVLNTTYRTFSTDESSETVEKTAGGDTAKSYIPLFVDGKASLEFIADGTAARVACAANTEGTLIYAPEGSVAGNYKMTTVAVVTSRKATTAYNDLEMVSVEFQGNALFADGTI